MYVEGGEHAESPWWETPYLEPSVVGSNPGEGGGDVPLWDTVSHYALMSLAVRNLMRALERNTAGEKVKGSCVRRVTVSELRAKAEAALAAATGDVAKLKLKRLGTPKETTEHPGYVPVEHVTLGEEVSPFTCDVQHVDFVGEDVLECLRHRGALLRRVKARSRKITSVLHWRVGKPAGVIREELMRREMKEAVAAKKAREPPPETVFGTNREEAALAPVVNDKRATMKVSERETIAGEVVLLHPEEHEARFLDLLDHELTRFDLHLNSIRYHVNLGIDFDSRGNMISPGVGRRCCSYLGFE